MVVLGAALGAQQYAPQQPTFRASTKLIVTTVVATRQGVVELAANQVVTSIWNFLALGLDALAIAAQALTGKALGAGDG